MYQIRSSQVAILAISDFFRLRSLWTFSRGNGSVGPDVTFRDFGMVAGLAETERCAEAHQYLARGEFPVRPGCEMRTRFSKSKNQNKEESPGPCELLGLNLHRRRWLEEGKYAAPLKRLRSRSALSAESGSF
jgi:hypothetical protein